MSRQFKPGQLKPGLLYDITSSYALTASYAVTASYVANASNPYRIVTGSISAEVDVKSAIFLIKSASNTILTVSQSGVVVFATQSAELTGSAPNGGMYFTSGSFFVGLD